MSLDFDYSRLKDKRVMVQERTVARPDGTVMEVRSWTPLGELMPFLCMIVGIPEVTARNAAEFYARVAAYEALFGSFLNLLGEGGAPVPRPITPDDVRAFIGLRTNASKLTSAGFRSDLFAHFHRERVEQFNRESFLFLRHPTSARDAASE